MVSRKLINVIKQYQVQFSLLVIIAISFTLFYPSLNYYFFQDDWFVLNWVRIGDLKSFLLPHADTIYWRPLSMPIFFWSGYKLFGLNSLLYHIVIFVFFGALIVSVYKLFRFLLEKRELALFGAFLYATWPVHFMSLSWLSTSSYILMALFQILSFIFFIKFIEKKKSYFWFVSLGFFLLGLFSQEFTLVLPLIIFSWGFLIKKRSYVRYILPFLAIDLIFVIARFIVFPFNAEGSYQIYFNHRIIDNFLWYLAWSLNFPESFKDLINQRFPTKSIKLLVGSWQIFLPVIMMLLINLNFLRKSIKKNLKSIVFGFLWIFTGLLPIIALVNHSYNVYLSFAGIGFLYIVLSIFKKTKAYFMYVFGALWLISSISNLKFTRSTHWVVNEQKISRMYTASMLKTVSKPEANSILLFWPVDQKLQNNYSINLVEEETIKLSLFNQSAVQVLYHDSSIKSIFPQHLEPLELPDNVQVYNINPHEEFFGE